jgi:hypothetical protein
MRIVRLPLWLSAFVDRAFSQRRSGRRPDSVARRPSRRSVALSVESLESLEMPGSTFSVLGSLPGLPARDLIAEAADAADSATLPITLAAPPSAAAAANPAPEAPPIDEDSREAGSEIVCLRARTAATSASSPTCRRGRTKSPRNRRANFLTRF